MKQRQASGWDSAVGATDLKTILAVVFAIGGLTWGATMLLGSREKSKPAGPKIVASALDDDGNAVEPEYTKAGSDKQVTQVQDEIQSIVQQRAATSLKQLTVPVGLPDAVSDAVLNAFIPILSGDYDSFVDAIAAMGGAIAGDLDEDHPMFTRLASVFEDARVDLNRISVTKYEAPSGQRRQMGRTQMTDDVDVEPGEEGQPAMQTSVMEMQPASMFPDAPGKNDPSALEVKIPVQPKGEEHESIFSIILTWNTDAKLWQPAAYRTIRNRLMEED